MFEARYRGWCEAGDDVIEPGDQVFYNPDGNLAHDTCYDPDDDPEYSPGDPFF